MTTNDKLKEIMEKVRLEYGENSILEEIKFKTESGDTIEYTVEKIYRIGRALEFGIISRTDNGKKFLVDIESIKKMAIYGYINNVVVTVGNALKPHKNKIAEIKRINNYDKISIGVNENSLESELENLKEEYSFITVIDNTNIEPISWLRLVPYGMIFDMSGNVCAVHVKDELGNKQLLDIKKFLKMTTPEYNMGKWSPRSETHNFYRALNYAEVDTQNYERLKGLLSEHSTKLFVEHECGKYYRCNIEKLRVEMARILYAEIDEEKEILVRTNVYYAIPRPEKFDTKSIFESALREAKHMDITKFDTDKYEVVEVDGLDRGAVFDLLLSRYNELHAGSYLKTNTNILEYVMKALNKELVKTEDIIRCKVLEIIKAYNDGNCVDSMLEEIGFRVENKDYEFKDEMHKEYIHAKLIGYRAEQSDLKEYMRPATLDELAEHFDLAHLIKRRDSIEVKEVTDMKKDNVTDDSKTLFNGIEGVDFIEDTTEEETEAEINEETKLLDIIYLTDDCKSKLEVKIECTGKICTYLVINDEYIRIDESEQAHLDYIKHGVDVSKIKRPLKRALTLLKNSNSIETVLEQLA